MVIGRYVYLSINVDEIIYAYLKDIIETLDLYIFAIRFVTKN